MSTLSPDVGSRVEQLIRLGDPGLLARYRVGLEKESLRVAHDGGISRQPHPVALGAALTHAHITTDYSEALLEMVTPPCDNYRDALQYLDDLHVYVSHRLRNEFLWATSMPCVLAGEENIPIAQYGTSNSGRMKHVYRVGLGYRYGRVMQVIAGVHYNFSFDAAFWAMYRELLDPDTSLRDFIDTQYMGLVRNLQRFGWIIPYLFGASPAVCKSFFSGKEPDLLVFDDSTYYEPFATSLRMGDIGYQNRKEEGMGIKANYDSLATYVRSLARATRIPCAAWAQIGVKVDGEYRQLNANQLQIENEYYSSIRPKQTPGAEETVSRALSERGIDYVELRSLDVNAYHPLGIDDVQMRFLHIFMVYCLLRISPPIQIEERKEIDRNLLWVASQGRDPQLKLQRGGKAVLFSQWGSEVLRAMQPVAELLANANADAEYVTAWELQYEKIHNPELTPSARMLREMRERGEGFYDCAQRLSHEQQRFFARRNLDPACEQELDRTAAESLQQQQSMEAADDVPFDEYLSSYFAGQIEV